MKVDTLIIGSGIAATAVSNRLLNDNPNASILILEAGQKVKMQNQQLWQEYVVNSMSGTKLPYYKYDDLPYPTQDEPGENLNIGSTVVPLAGSRVMTYGGSTIHWGGWSYRLMTEDFHMKTNTGKGLNWPIDYKDLEPYYTEAEHYIGVAGDYKENVPPRNGQHYPFDAYPYTLEDESAYKAMQDLKLNPSHVPIARHGITNTTSLNAPCKTTGTCKYCPFGARYAAPNFLNDMVDWGNYPKFEIRINAVVEIIDMDSKNRAKGVPYYDKTSQKMVTVQANTVIVAGGAIESPKVLLRSRSALWPNGIGNGDGADNDYNPVGRYYVTHPYFIFTSKIEKNPHKLQPEMDFPTLCTRYYDSKKEQAKGKFILLHPPNSPQPLVRNKSSSLTQMMQQGMRKAEILEALKGPAQVEIHGMVEIFSHYENRIMNLDKNNRIGLPETIVDYSQSPEFNQRMKEIRVHVNKIFAKMGAEPANQLSVSWRADHSACTCRMGKNAQEAVTDKNMKVFGVDNLYVCSNAAFTCTGAINPTLTLTALSLRLADHLITLNKPNKSGGAQT